MKIGIIVGSVRDEQAGASVGEWVLRHAQAKGGAEFEPVSLKDFDLPVFSSATLPAMADKSYDSEQVQAWSRVVDDLDGYIFVTPEYNHGVPAALKNAFDVLYPEWVHKGAALVSYGADGGVRAVEHWRTILANAQMHVVRGQVSFSTMLEVEQREDGDVFAPAERRTKELGNVLRQLTRLTDATASLRS